MVPPLDNFQWKNRNCSSLARMISASRRSFFANLTTFERPSGIKMFFFSKSWFWEGKNSWWLTSKLVLFYRLMQPENKKSHPMVPHLHHFQRGTKKCSSLTRMISASRRSFFANLSTFERRSGLKKISFYKIAIFKIGWLSKFQSHRFWGDAHLSLGAAQAPPN